MLGILRTSRVGQAKRVEPLVMLRPLYEKIQNMDLHRDEGLHGIDELEGMLRKVSEDQDFKMLVKLCKREQVGFINRKRDRYGAYYLNVDSEGVFSGIEGNAFPEDGGRDIPAKDIREFLSWLYPEDISPSVLKRGLLSYVTYAPHGYVGVRMSDSER